MKKRYVNSFGRLSLITLSLLCCSAFLISCAGGKYSAPPPREAPAPAPAPGSAPAPAPGSAPAPAPGSAPAPAPPPSIDYSCRGYLIPNIISEDPGYGLYSYILFNGKPSIGSIKFDRYLSLYAATINTFPLSDKTKISVPKKNINFVYWPLRPDSDYNVNFYNILSYEEDKNKHAFFIKQYDYVTADIILGKIRGLRNLGPFIVGYRAPLSKFLYGQIVEKEMLVVDLTRVSKESFEDVLKWYKQKVTDDPKTWENNFDWEMIKIHFKDALITHGEPMLVSIEWVGDYFGVKEAFAKP